MAVTDLSGLIDLAPDPLIAVEADGGIILVNGAAAKLALGLVAGGHLPALLQGGEDAFATLMDRCAHTGDPIPARLTVKTGTGTRSFQARVQRRGGIAESSGLMIHLPVSTERRFSALNSTLGQLRREVTDHRRTEARLRESLRHNALLLQELRHRVKNNMALLQALVRQQERSAGDESARRALETVSARMTALHVAQQHIFAEGRQETVPVSAIVLPLLQASAAFCAPPAETDLSITENFPLRPDETNALALVVNEVLTNSVKHAVAVPVRLSLGAWTEDGERVLRLADNGQGFPEGPGTAGLGRQLIEGLTKQLRARIVTANENGAVTLLRMRPCP